MHDDERRDEVELERLLLAEFVRDPQALRRKYQGLLERDKQHRARLEALEEQLAAAEDRARKLKKKRASLEQENSQAAAQLEVFRSEFGWLETQLDALRSSRAVRLARALRRLRRSLRRLRKRLTGRSSAGSRPGTRKASGASTGRRSGSGRRAEGAPEVRDASPRRASEKSLEELFALFHAGPSPARLGDVLNRAWYQHGMLAEPAELVEQHPELVAELAPRAGALARRVLGARRLAGSTFPLPARGGGPAYVPEVGRVMYCAHSTPVFESNGYAMRTRGIASGLAAAGTDVVVVGRSGYPWDAKSQVEKPALRRHVENLDGVDYVHLPGHSLATTPLDHYIQECADAFVREARLQRPSIIHAASNYQLGLAALTAARRLGLPFVYEVRGLWEYTEAVGKPDWKDTERFALHVELETLVAREADRVLAITAQTRDELIRRGVAAEKIHLAENCVDPRAFLPLPQDGAFATSHDIDLGVPVIGYAGSMVPYEGLHLLLQAAASLRGRGARFQVVLAGSGSAEEELRELAEELDLGETVTFLGRLPAEEMPRLMSVLDVVVCPRLSVAVTELVAPLKPLEAMSAGKAVVLSDLAPHRDIAGGAGDRAVLFEAGNADALADVLADLVDQPETRADLGRTARLWCVDERSWSDLATTLQHHHQQVLAAPTTSDLPSVGSLRVGLVADEFTTATLRGTVDVVPLDRGAWREQLAGLDLVFIESAWNGNGGQWHRGVGYYSPEEHRDLAELLEQARRDEIPSIFWNKEDPVHFNRFVRTAAMCDHVFTTDADRVVPYLEASQAVGVVRTASSLPFYAQPAIHNPLPSSRPFETTVAYAGTYYGDRYPERSKQLVKLLEAAEPIGLAIYDRQAAIPDSPYHFPADLRPAVRGALPYDEVLDSYKSHLANLNVNSVTGSPSMFSRRVVEVAASGGVVLSGPGRGITETFGTAIASGDDSAFARAHLRHWAESPIARQREAWLQMRAVLRAHTVETAMIILARTAGIAVEGRSLPAYGVLLPEARSDLVASLTAQSVPPAEVWAGTLSEQDAARLTARGVRVHVAATLSDADPGTAFLAEVREPVDRTYFEDLLLATEFGDWDRIVDLPDHDVTHGEPLAEPVAEPPSGRGLVARSLLGGTSDLAAALHAPAERGLLLRRPGAAHPAPTASADQTSEPSHASARSALKVVVAGHDLKFAAALLGRLEEDGAELRIDQWQSHTVHDPEQSEALLSGADVVFCEWGLGNAVWYSQHVGSDQRLVVRVHSQELRTPHLRAIDHDRVDAYIFVGELVLEAAVRSHGLPREKCHVVPNAVDCAALALEKHPDATHTIGLVGIVPASKRLDLALDVLEGLLADGSDYRLRLKGKRPEDYPWMRNRPQEMAYYDRQLERIERINAAHPSAVLLDGHGPDMANWYRHIGVALSVSDFESFHLTIADGAASGAMPALLAWPGSDLIYPRQWISPTVPALVERIRSAPRDPRAWQAVAQERFAADRVLDDLAARVTGGQHQR
ncbi:glycosyltransferase [Desertihabitans brevis]|uniref:Glycosyltransferase n=1 Tax=Desertihabitans brevis TaxID=2268447 RepID=A0A367YTC4_9ACTN|nr:glycosyltransferase [Desertihabitans brevis]RCK69143.1 glycosyltransferase [Desertihabitans brevis]